MAPMTDETTIEKLSSMLIDTALPLKLRFRILFTLKSLNSQGQQQTENPARLVDAISQAFSDSSALLKHECAYCLGQMGDRNAIAKLVQILNDSNEDPMVRHEAGRAWLMMKYCHRSSASVNAGEALGAMGCFDIVEVVDALTKQSRNARSEVRKREREKIIGRGQSPLLVPVCVRSLKRVKLPWIVWHG